ADGTGDKHRSLGQDVWRQFRRHKGAVVGLIMLSIIVVASSIGPLIYPLDPFEIDVPNANLGPTLANPMGTDNLGRDVMARVLIGGRISLAVGFAAMFVGVFVGVGVGVAVGQPVLGHGVGVAVGVGVADGVGVAVAVGGMIARIWMLRSRSPTPLPATSSFMWYGAPLIEPAPFPFPQSRPDARWPLQRR
ncbi:MAG: hypothetical protein IIA91_10920, partial [Chloroflexi bacterium]|nr:hypothetical protein [Chloroflexota bacterium]